MRFGVVFILLAILVGWRSEPPQPPVRTKHLAPVLPHRHVLRVLGAPNRFLLADYYWIKTIHAVGIARSQEQYADVFYYADLTTDLDPAFRPVYGFAGAAIPLNLGREHWVNTDLSTRLLEKGLRHYPRDLHLHILLAYNYSYFHKDYGRAAYLLTQASRLSGAPEYLPQLATRLYAQAGEFDAGKALAEALAQETRDPELQAFFQERLKQIELEQQLSRLDRAVESFQQRTGRPPSLQELLITGELEEIPTDPLGGTIYIDEEGVARSTSQERRLRTFDPAREGR